MNRDRNARAVKSFGSPRRIMRYNIGEVLSLLKEDFPGVTASKIRFYEEKGLITPQRTAAGYRQFEAADIERLRFVLALQRDHFLPLKVIRDYLQAIDRGEQPENLPSGIAALLAPKLVAPEDAVTHAARTRQLSPQQLREESGASAELFQDLCSFGLITSVNGMFDDYALKVTKTCVALSRYGIDARHLRAVRTATEREFGLLERVVTPLRTRKDGLSEAQATETAREIGGHFATLYMTLLQERIDSLGS